MAKIELGDWQYIEETPFKWNNGIRIEFKENIPEYLYKYYPSNENSFNAISNNNFFCSHPFHFNDLTDSTPLSYNFKDLCLEDFKNYYEDLVDENQLLLMYEEDKLNLFRSYCNHYYSELNSMLGFISLTKNKMNNLMWGHYSSDSGFKVKFNTPKLVESINKNNEQNCLFFPINYIENKLHIDTSEYGNRLPLLVDISTKVNDWKYENEWRFIITKSAMSVPESLVSLKEDYKGENNRFASYDADSIEEIVLGFNFFNGKNFSNKVLKTSDEYRIDAKSQDVTSLLKFICNNKNIIIRQAGLKIDSEENILIPNTNSLRRSLERIEIKHISHFTFSVFRVNRNEIEEF
ncbi:DUF2971 domain-containing protein [Flavobacterium gawalongense]|uniref:DUF2971 domain-containing protein n=1 Tax=Flavobacterium gawalongense TaxID=2594432 RepID=A0A553BWB6_9FLAO|nr:DUF2971 domain-containing protein [Flavobacterium gawalongense]TRX02057.1 DUF2971 domain-containing protein [Flavobacterium gawalongense]TRX06585.1 DUF2971 domain-containing protein [Flavobacterium gawalongense]TRX12486.1 DUF2971 domain-containing protein [Flavobacterium gawalongense]TRX12693.1 DUF2971 domain-containing protein [Flavobacterium gawalongense]TRX30518.1 DUF2971 domain-containing protein [Flavobacterium gawalongense]